MFRLFHLRLCAVMMCVVMCVLRWVPRVLQWVRCVLQWVLHVLQWVLRVLQCVPVGYHESILAPVAYKKCVLLRVAVPCMCVAVRYPLHQ